VAVVSPGPLPGTIEEARAVRAAGKLDIYERGLKALANSPDPTTSRRAYALLGLFYSDQGQPAEAVPVLARAADAYPEVAPWLRIRLAELEREAGHFAEAIAADARVVQQTPATTAATVARIRLPALYALAGDITASDASLRDAMSMTIDELTEQEFVAAANDLAKAGRTDLATAIRMRLLTQYPQGRFTEATYDELTKNASPLDSLSTGDAVALATRLGSQDRYDQAFDLLRRIAQRSPEVASSPDYRVLRMHAQFNSRRYQELLAETKARDLNEPRLILMRARAAWRADQSKEFLEGLKHVERKHPKSAEAIEAKILRAKYHTVDEPKLDVAIDNLEEAVKLGGPGTEGETLWTLGWTYVLAQRYDEALQTFQKYGQRFPDGDYQTNALFWSGKIHHRLGHIDQRNAAFQTLIASYPFSYYSYRAREIMDQPPVALAEIANGNLFPNVEAEIAAVQEPRLESVRELSWLGLHRDATREMKAIATANPGNAGLAFMLADLYAEGGEPFKATLILQRRFRQFIRHGGSGVPHRFWEILFPLKYWESIRSEAQRRQIDPYLVASIIRQESGFEPSVVSNAGAVGIMQIMPPEADRIAAAAGLEVPTRQQLFDPAHNIVIGVAEYAQKLIRMNSNHILAIAAYNAGEEAVGKWLAQTPVDDVDLFVESIPYNETRLYVKSVTRNRYEYRRIYEGVSSSSQ
jgi:soluble lytic murein transglycosylase